MLFLKWNNMFLILPNKITALSDNLPVTPQSCWRTAEPSRSLRRSSAARARLWSARVTAATPPCTSAGIATPACPWWTSVSLWRYPHCVFVSLNCLLPPTSHKCFLSSVVAVESSRLSVCSLSWSPSSP